MPSEQTDNNDPSYEPEGQPPVEGEQPPNEEAQPDFETRFTDYQQSQNERFEKIQEEMRTQNAEVLSTMNQVITQQATPAPVQQAAPAPGVTREQVVQSLESGEGPQQVLSYIDQQISSASKKGKEELDQLYQLGHSQISALGMQQARVDPTMPNFARFEKEINTEISKANLAADPQTVRNVYRYIVGTHHEELLKEEKEKTLRQSHEEKNSSIQATGQKDRIPSEKDDHDPQKILSESNWAALSRKNSDPDTEAKKQGYTDFAEMQDRKKASEKKNAEIDWTQPAVQGVTK